MSLAGELRDLYTPQQPSPEQIETIDIVTDDVTIRFLIQQPVVHPQVESDFPILMRVKSLVDYYAPGGQSDQYIQGEEEPVTDIAEILRKHQERANTEWFLAGFSLATAMFATTVGEIAMYNHEGLKSELQSPFDDDKVFAAVQSTARTQHDEILGEETMREWSENFPALARIATKLHENRPMNLDHNFDVGIYEGIHYYPSALARLALAAEMPEL